MQGRLVFSLNDDGTVTLRCDADRFFANANEIRRLLSGGEDVEDEASEPPGAAVAGSPVAAAAPETDDAAPAEAPDGDTERGDALDLDELAPFWSRVFPEAGEPRSRDLTRASAEVLAAGYYLTQERGFEAFTRADVARVFAALPDAAEERRTVKSGTLGHLAKKGWLERVRRGCYQLGRRGVDRIASLAEIAPRPLPKGSRPAAALPSLNGLSRFLREVPANRKWRRVLLVAYFLQEHCGIEEFDQRLIAACFQRLRGVDAPGSLPSLISQVLYKRRGLLERGSRRGVYQLSPLVLEELRHDPRVADANAFHRAQQMRRTG